MGRRIKTLSLPQSILVCQVQVAVLHQLGRDFSSLYLYRANGRGGFGSQIAADPPLATPDKSWKADCGYCDSFSQNANPASTFDLSQCRHCKERLPGPRKGFWVASSSPSPPKRPRPFTHYSLYLQEARKGWVWEGFLCKHVRLSWLWRSECQMYCWFQYPWVFSVSWAWHWIVQKPPLLNSPFLSTKNVTGRRFYRTTEAIPRRPWKAKRPFTSRPCKKGIEKGTRGVRVRHGMVLLPFSSIVQGPVVQPHLSPILGSWYLHDLLSTVCKLGAL